MLNETKNTLSPSTLISLNDSARDPKSRKPKIFVVHSLPGTAHTDYRWLGPALDSVVQFIGIRAPVEKADIAASVEILAAHYCTILLEAHPSGPFLLGGWSAGGMIALEMARQLRARGREVSLLVILDTFPGKLDEPILPPSDPRYLFAMARNFPDWLYDAFLKDRKSIPMRIRRFLNNLLFSKKKHPAEKYALYPHYLPSRQSFMRQFYDANIAYDPPEYLEKYSGDVLLCEAKLHGIIPPLLAERWKAWASKVEVVRTPGTHTTMVLEPYVYTLAAHIKERILKLYPNGLEDEPRQKEVCAPIQEKAAIDFASAGTSFRSRMGVILD